MNVRHDMVVVYVTRRINGRIEFLQMRRAETDFHGGTWQTVYGTSKPGEPLWRAALRELFEETGIRPAEFYRLPTLHSFYIADNDTVWHASGFLAIVEPDVEVTLNEEHTAFRWIDRADVARAFMWPSDRASIDEAVNEILLDGPGKRFLRLETG